MRKALIGMILFGSVAVQAFARTKPAVDSVPAPRDTIRVIPADSGPVLSGTINVVVASNRGIVVLTDSMITERSQDEHGVLHTRQRTDPGQKLFRLDDRTVCAFAGFASAATPPLPDFINSVSAIIGRYERSLRQQKPFSFQNKLELLEALFTYYLTGVANIRNATAGTDNYAVYSFELFLAGYDLDGAPKVGTLSIGMSPQQVGTVQLWHAYTQERNVFPVTTTDPIIFLHGKITRARLILSNPKPWTADPAVAMYDDAVTNHRSLTLDQMKALAISLKQHTAEIDPTVGGPSQVATLVSGQIQSFEQPAFPEVSPIDFKFHIISTLTVGNPGIPGKPIGRAVVFDGFGLFLGNRFIHANQDLDNGYFAKNEFRDCVLICRGGSIQFLESNQVTDTDLILGPGVSRSSPEVEQLLKFRWRSVDDRRAKTQKAEQK
jgi:hypothetical protein